jgi:GT2 family glycosyltransferase/2-polyprenyl-3-methyl-5-hydroxy-6-metoxy-1,4-benzoquinol methylase
MEGDALRYDTEVDLNDLNTARTQLVLLTGLNKRVLEVGPATGYITKVLQKRGCSVTGIEIDPAAAAEAEPYAARMLVGDVESFDLEAVLGNERFDAVMFGDVLEHLVDPAGVLSRVRTLLSDEGSVIASIPNVAHGSVRLALLSGQFPYASQGLLDRTHLRFFTRDSLERLFQRSGFDITEWRRTTADVFETELDLERGEYPSDLVESVRAMPESETYQFVVRAEPSDRSSTALVAPAVAATAGGTFRPIWRRQERVARLESELREQRALIEAKQRVIEEADKVAEAREARLRELTELLRVTEEELGRARSSAAFRLARLFRRWAPPGTIRGWLLKRLRRAAYGTLARVSTRAEQQGSEAESPVVTGVATVTPPVYQRWIDRHERSRQALEAERPTLARLAYQPLISIVVPTWRPVPGQLRHTLQSILDQTHERWELCIADGGSDMQVRRLLSRFKERDERIHVRFLEENLGISGNTMEAFALATGEFVAFVDQSDVLAPDALARVVESLNRNPGLDLLYSDWDLLSGDGRARFNPYFTPEWSPDLLLSANYMTHLSVVRRRLVEEVGGLRSDLDGAQDWDLMLRVIERTDQIARIPGILYHWRADPSSAALTLHQKPAAEAAQRRAVQEHLDRRGSSGSVVRTPQGHLRIRWTLRDRPTVSIIIPTRHNRELVERCLAGIHRSSYPEREVIVVETAGRTTEREEWYRTIGERFPLTVLWWERPFNYSAVNNFAARHTSGEVLLFLNDDTEPLTDDWIEEIIGWLQQEGVGAVGAQLLAEDGSIQHGGVVLGMQGFAEHFFRGLEPDRWTLLGSSAWYRNVSAVTGACLGISKGVFERIGGWDERFELCGSDVELCLRVWREGLRVVVDPYARLRHIERATRGSSVPQSDFCVSLWHYQRHLYGGDPFFSPNLSYQDPIPRLRGPDDLSSLRIVSEVIGRDVAPRPPGDDQGDAPILVEALKVDPSDVAAIHRAHATNRGRREIGSITWFIPDFENPFYGGIHTIFRFADRFHQAHGVENRFAVTGTGPEEFIRSGLRVAFPDIADSDIFVIPGGADSDLQKLPQSDAAICTLWVTAYPMARWRGADRYFSFVQDFEPMFYPAGALYALAEETYRMGFFGIANTPPLKDIYESYGGRAASFIPCIDPDVFHPRDAARPEAGPFTVFMYARPGHPRNCYELALAALRRLKDSMGDQVRVVTAGSWSGSQTEPWLDQLGFLDYRETADLYRQCDAGLVLSVSKHPTYIPLQLMACGALVVANDNPANGWLLRDGENALLADPTPDALAASLERGLGDRELRARLSKQAAIDIGERHSDWASEIDRIYGFMCDPGAQSPSPFG